MENEGGLHCAEKSKKPAKAIRVYCVIPAAIQAYFIHVLKMLTKFFS